jgi:hypothetical protein
MIDLLQQYEGTGILKANAIQDELKQSVRRLESFISPIRMSQAIKTGSGPLDGMRNKIMQLANLSQKKDDLTSINMSSTDPEEPFKMVDRHDTRKHFSDSSKNAAAKDGLGEILFEPKSGAEVEYVFLTKLRQSNNFL